MTVEEAKTILGRIKIHYPDFSNDKNTQKEWIRELVLYDTEDVTRKLESHLRNEDYGDKIPKLFFLTSKLIPSLDKGKVRHYTILCSKCGYEIPDEEYDKHLQRCIEASTVVRDMKKYFSMNIQKKKLMALSDEEFEKLYQSYLNKMLDADIPDFRKKIILRCIYPDMDIDVNGIVNEMVGK